MSKYLMGVRTIFGTWRGQKRPNKGLSWTQSGPSVANPEPCTLKWAICVARWSGRLTVLAASVLLIAGPVDGGFLNHKGSWGQNVSHPMMKKVATEKSVDTKTRHIFPKTVSSSCETTEATWSGITIATEEIKEPLPKVPTVLLVVSGHEAMVPLVRVHLESIVMESGLKVASVSEIPMLQEKMQVGRTPITWYVIEPLVPEGKAHLLVLAEVRRSGSVALEYEGRVQEMVTATFTVRSMEMDSGSSVIKPISGSMRFTQLNMDENIKAAVTSASGSIGVEMKQYWEKKIGASSGSGFEYNRPFSG